MLKLYRKSPRRKILAIFCLLLFFAGCVWYARTSAGFIADAYVYVASPIRIVGGYAATIGFSMKDFFASRQKRENVLAVLREENRKLQESVAHIVELQAENTALRDAVTYNLQPTTYNLVMARVVGKGAHIFGQEIVLNQGSEAGIRVGDAVLFGERTLIGRITSVTPHHARVTLLSHRNFRAMVKILDASDFDQQPTTNNLPPKSEILNLESYQVEGLIRGEGFGNVVLDMVPSGALLKEGDIVVTSGFDNLFPPGLVIGKVAQMISGPADFFQKGHIIPAAEMGVVDMVMVLEGSL